MKTRKKTEPIAAADQDMGCAGFHELLDWQIIQYRQAVNEYRLELSKELHRCVPWQEAEHEFASMGLHYMGAQWRTEYCGFICSQRKQCLLAMQFLDVRDAESMHRVG